MSEQNPELELAYNFVFYTNKNVFLTGKAGTGKTTFLRNLQKNCLKRMIVVAPTGVAAINAGGVTIHSFFQLPFGPMIPKSLVAETSSSQFSASQFKLNKTKISIIRSLDLLVIDEISMVRADLLDGIDEVLRHYKNRNKPFGGVQLLMIGDIQQLAPVIKDDEWSLLQKYYKSVFFFESFALKGTDYITIELKHIYRQSDQVFIDLLNDIRNNNLNKDTIKLLNSRFIPDFKPLPEDGFITLTTHNWQANEINSNELNRIKSSEYKFFASIIGEFPEYIYPTEPTLILKANSQVMFIKNDPNPEKSFYNGKIGIITNINNNYIEVLCKGDVSPIKVQQTEWKNVRYSLNEDTKDIIETEIGSFTQYPLKLAWAITIHKSQGLTFEKAIIHAGASFAHGQVYVALSRCKTLEGMVLGTPLTEHSVIVSSDVTDFNQNAVLNTPDEAQFKISKQKYIYDLLDELYDYSIISRNTKNLYKTVTENSSAVIEYKSDFFEQFVTLTNSELAAIAEKFNPQLKKLTEEYISTNSDVNLQNRIKAASQYFIAKVTDAVKLLEKIQFETDNKAILKQINDQVSNIYTDYNRKLICLKACENGFDLVKYINIKAKANLDSFTIEKKTKDFKNPKATTQNIDLLGALKEWREKVAIELDVLEYQILNRNTLNLLVTEMPVTEKELKNINGIGRQKLKQFGKFIIEIIKKFKNTNSGDSEIVIDSKPEIKENNSEKQDKIPSKQISFNLYKNGLNLADIAKERNLALTTIEGHLADYVKNGEIDIFEIVEQEKVNTIMKYFSASETKNLAPAKLELGENYSYGELKMVLGYMEQINN